MRNANPMDQITRLVQIVATDRLLRSLGGSLGMARRYGRPAEEITKLENQITEVRDKLAALKS